MIGNALSKVKDCSENDALSLSYYLYQMCIDVSDFSAHEECQVLYNALVDRLNLGNHADEVLDALSYKLEKTKQLTPARKRESYMHPFLFKRKLKTNYRQDESIFDDSG